jgi:hypothetical protein
MQNPDFTCSFTWTWNLVLTLSVKCRLRVFENRVLRKKYGPKRGVVTDEWGKFCDFYDW